MRILVRVKPGASRTKVGGWYDGPSGPALVVAVAARAVGGQATKAVLQAVADALGVRRSAVTLVRPAGTNYWRWRGTGRRQRRN